MLNTYVIITQVYTLYQYFIIFFIKITLPIKSDIKISME